MKLNADRNEFLGADLSCNTMQSIEDTDNAKKNLPNAIKLMNGKYGGGFYAHYFFDKGSGTGWIQLTIEYPTGETIGVPICKNICKIVEDSSKTLGEGASYSYVKKRKDYQLTTKMKTLSRAESFNAGDYASFQQFERPDMPIPIIVLWEQICKRWETIPIINIQPEYTPRDVYYALLDLGESKGEKYRDDYGYFITSSEFKEICDEYELSFPLIRISFQYRGLLDKDATTQGYQKSKKIDGKKYNFYHIKKSGFEKVLNASDEGCLDYTEKSDKTPNNKPPGLLDFARL